MVIFVWAIARSPARSTTVPPRKCRIRTPRANPSRLTRMNSSNGPCHHVAIILPSGCQTSAKRSHARASRHRAQASTSRRISTSSLSGVRMVTSATRGRSEAVAQPRPAAVAGDDDEDEQAEDDLLVGGRVALADEHGREHGEHERAQHGLVVVTARTEGGAADD